MPSIFLCMHGLLKMDTYYVHVKACMHDAMILMHGSRECMYGVMTCMQGYTCCKHMFHECESRLVTSSTLICAMQCMCTCMMQRHLCITQGSLGMVWKHACWVPRSHATLWLKGAPIWHLHGAMTHMQGSKEHMHGVWQARCQGMYVRLCSMEQIYCSFIVPWLACSME